MKCNNCRKLEALDTRWDRIRLRFFHLFHKDIIDLSQDKFTQGFSDGYVVGRRHQKEEDQEIIKLLSEPGEKPVFAPIVDLNKVLTEKNGKLFLNGEIVNDEKVKDLKEGAHLLRNTALWEIITNTLENQAYEAGWTKSKNYEDLMNGKAIAYTIEVQKKIIQKIEQAL